MTIAACVDYNTVFLKEIDTVTDMKPVQLCCDFAILSVLENQASRLKVPDVFSGAVVLLTPKKEHIHPQKDVISRLVLHAFILNYLSQHGVDFWSRFVPLSFSQPCFQKF